MRKSIILFMTFFLCIVGYAQKRTISGTVTDKELLLIWMVIIPSM